MMALVAVPLLATFYLLFCTKTGIRIVLTLVILATAAVAILFAFMIAFSIFVPEHVEHLNSILKSRYENPHHRLRDFFAHFFPWSY